MNYGPKWDAEYVYIRRSITTRLSQDFTMDRDVTARLPYKYYLYFT